MGWGWENGFSCVRPGSVAASSVTPECGDSTVDYDGDGWAWEAGHSCTVRSNTQVSQGQASPGRPPGGVVELPGVPVCSSGVVDYDGDGWAWEAGQSCTVVTGSQNQVAGTENSIHPLPGVPVCSSASIDTDGDGWGVEHGRSCQVAFSIFNPLDSNDTRHFATFHSSRMNYGPCAVPSPVGGGCLRHSVTDATLANGGLVGGDNRWHLNEINSIGVDDVYVSWYQRFVNRQNVGQGTKIYGLSAANTEGYEKFRGTSESTLSVWNYNYQNNVSGGQSGGGAGWFHGGLGPNGLGKSWSVRLLHGGGFGFENTGLISAEVYHTDSTNIHVSEGAKRQFGENIRPFLVNGSLPIGSSRIIDDSWHHVCLRVKLNSLSPDPFNQGIVRDGVLQVWVNGALIIYRDKLHFTEDPAFRDWRFWGLAFGGGDTQNTEAWQYYTDGIKYSQTGCSK